MRSDTLYHDNVETTVDHIIATVGKDIRLGMPLGLGKPTQLVNALYARAKADPSIQLTILTALSLEKPIPGNDIEKRFLQPFIDRVWDDCPDLDYALDCSHNKLPKNVVVKEFFFRPGSRLRNAHAQQQYINSNYTHAARDVFDNGCNVATQIVARREQDGDSLFSLSCNPDTSPELIEMLNQAQAAGERTSLVIGQVNQKLPYMYQDAEVDSSGFDVIVDNADYYTTLFSTPKTAVATADYMIGLNASALIRDGGTLQIGIGALGDAIVYAAQLRHDQNSTYKKILADAEITDKASDLIDKIGGTEPFEKGLYGATEMFVDGFMHLYQSGILKRRVYDFAELQQLLNEGEASEVIDSDVLEKLRDLGVRVIRTADFEVLQYHGLFRDDCQYDEGYIIAPDGERIMANLGDPASCSQLTSKCLGQQLRNGVVLHGGFFLGPRDFYDTLNNMSDEARRDICMTGVYKVNQLDHAPDLYKAQRIHARFVNTGLMATLSGAVVSDGLENGKVVSGVGGQYNFVATAHHLITGRSILMIRAVREKDGVASSNVVFNYGHCTIPRHLRDMVVTEYGVAMLRGRTDAEVAKAMLNITDSRFQQALLDKAKRAGKIEQDYQIPAQYRNNSPARLEAALKPHRNDGLFPALPFGTDLNDTELALAKALKGVKARTADKYPIKAIFDALTMGPIPAAAKPYLERMDLENPSDNKLKLVQRLLVQELSKQGLF